MAVNAGPKAVHRFGVRYGRTVKANFAAIEVQQKKLYKCPYCAKAKVRRQAIGIWQCQKCLATFTGKAYTILKKKEGEAVMPPPEAAAAEEPIEEEQLEEESLQAVN